MKCLILAAGYATRLYPLTENFPKPLLAVGDKTILDWLIDDLAAGGDRAGDRGRFSVSLGDEPGKHAEETQNRPLSPHAEETQNRPLSPSEFIVISNHRFAHHFEEWAAARRAAGKPGLITVLDDGTSTNETRLGAVKDMAFAVAERHIDEDLLVIAGDNVLDFSLNGFIAYAREKGTSCTMRYYEEDEARLRKSGVSEIGEGEILVSLEEKPANPKSHWCTPPFYYYRREDAARIGEAIADGCGTDAPGSLVSWMCRHTAVHSWEMPGRRYDIGNLESYRQVQETYRGITK